MELDFKKAGGLIPAIIQDERTNKVLMLGFMNEEALEKTQSTGKVTFFSRTKNRLWTKGEESGNFLNLISITEDCDNDTLLIKVHPVGPVCHTGDDTCFKEKNEGRHCEGDIYSSEKHQARHCEGDSPKQSIDDIQFLKYLQDFIDRRRLEMPENSYTTSLFTKGIGLISQKVGEEAVETIIEAMKGDDERMLYEASDLLYHLIVLLTYKGYRIEDLAKELKRRHKKN